MGCGYTRQRSARPVFLIPMTRLRPELMIFRDRNWDWDSILAKIETKTETDTQNIGFTRPRPGLRPQSVTRLETDTETLLHNFGEIYKILILFPYSINFSRPRLILRLTFWKNRFRDWDWYLENSRDDAETESLVPWSHETWPMPRVSPTSVTHLQWSNVWGISPLSPWPPATSPLQCIIPTQKVNVK